MSTPISPQQPSKPEKKGLSGTPDTVEVTNIAPPVVDPTEGTEMAAIDAPVATGGGISAAMPGAGAFSFATIGGRTSGIWRMLTRNPKVMVGLSIVVFFMLVAIFGPLLLHTDPNAFSPDTLQPRQQRTGWAPPRWDKPSSPSSCMEHAPRSSGGY